jgi:hypothetical protein
MQYGSPEGGTAVYAQLVQKVRFGTIAGGVVDHSTLAVDADVDELDVQRHRDTHVRRTSFPRTCERDSQPEPGRGSSRGQSRGYAGSVLSRSAHSFKEPHLPFPNSCLRLATTYKIAWHWSPSRLA